MIEFIAYPKMARLSREVIISEKIDGTNACICITEDGEFLAGSRNRWITPEADNFGFARWAQEHKGELLHLGPGRHFGEWWGSGIQRGYGLPSGEKRFSLFNVTRCEKNPPPPCCGVVPVLYRGPFDTYAIEDVLADLAADGSHAAPFMNPEGIVIFHVASGTCFKKTIKDDAQPKSVIQEREICLA